LDVTENKVGLPTATRVAKAICQQIRDELQLTASAGVAPNKFLARIASDWRKPDGLSIIEPEDVQTFLPPLPVGRISGVGKVTETRLKQMSILTVGGLQALDLAALEARFGRYRMRLYELARGGWSRVISPQRDHQEVSGSAAGRRAT
jgi:DNA polymerase-4